MLAAVEAGLPVVEYTPAEIKRAVVGYGRAEKAQVGQMVKLLLGPAGVPLARTTRPTPWPWRSATCIPGSARAHAPLSRRTGPAPRQLAAVQRPRA